MSDRNLYYRIQREKLQEPLIRANVLPSRSNSLFYPSLKYAEYKKPSGGADKNLFYQLQDKGKTATMPFLQKRTFKDLDPQTRVIGKLDLTKEEVQRTNLLKSIQSISGLLNDFISSPQTDELGNIVLNPLTNEPKIKKRTLEELLKVAHDSVREMFQDLNISLNNNQKILIDTLTVDEAKSVISDTESILSNESQRTDPEVFLENLLNEKIGNLDEKTSEAEVGAIQTEILDSKDIEGDWEKDKFHSRYMAPEAYKKLDRTQKNNLIQFIYKRENKSDDVLTNARGENPEFRNYGQTLGSNFGRNKYLDLEELKFVDKPADI